MSEIKKTCATCEYDGCCVDLPFCGGVYWRQAVPEDGEEAQPGGDPWEGYDPRDAMEERAANFQAMMDRMW